MVRLSAENAEGAIQLLDHEKSYETMRDRELTERDQLARAFAKLVGMSVGTADYEHDRCTRTVIHF